MKVSYHSPVPLFVKNIVAAISSENFVSFCSFKSSVSQGFRLINCFFHKIIYHLPLYGERSLLEMKSSYKLT